MSNLQKATYNRLKAYLLKRKITKYELLAAGVLTPADITRIGAGHHFSDRWYMKLCRYLGCSINDIKDELHYLNDDDF